MIKELIFKFKIKKLDKIHIKQYLERKGYEIFHLDTEQGKKLTEKLKIEISDDDSIVYNTGRFRYVFIGRTSNEADELMLLLHECGHIEHKHKTTSKHNEAEAWNFAYTVAELPSKIIKALALIILPAALTFALMQNQSTITIPTASPKYYQPDTLSDSAASQANNQITEDDVSDTVYITKYGEKFHIATCRYVRNKNNLISIPRSEAEKSHSPCNVCISK